MKRFIVAVSILAVAIGTSLAQGAKPKVILLITEQNIGVPQRAWWAGEIDLSATEAVVAQKLAAAGYEIVDPSSVAGVIKQDKAFRVVNVPEKQKIALAKTGGAPYIVTGRAVASAGNLVPQSNMRSYAAVISARLIRATDGTVMAYFLEQGSSAHIDAVLGGTEALNMAGQRLAERILQALAQDSEQTKQ